MADPSTASAEDTTAKSPDPPVQDSIELGTEAKDEDAADDKSENLNEPDAVEDEAAGERPVSNDQYRALKHITEVLTNYKVKVKGDEDHYPSTLFRRIPNRRNLPDYHEIIKDPVALSTLKGKIQRKQYTGIPEFVRDFALIVHNAQVYNRPNSAPVRDVLELQTLFRAELQKLVEESLVKEDETEFPDLGEIPYATPEPDPVSEEEDENEDDQDQDEDEDDDEGDADDSDDDRRKRKGRRGRASMSGRKGGNDDDENKLNDGDVRKRRGRPPKVDTPLEARIKAILKGLRKPKDKAGHLRVRHFERLPDKAEYPAYFVEIKEPIALDTIKKKAKRKKYQSLEHFMKDIELLFNNAKDFNQDSSEIYQDAVELHTEAVRLLDVEKAKPDDEYLMEDGRRPLPSGILHNNELWKVGDWVHIKNPNDVTKPIVAQIYRTWEDTDGQKWINACWYYRPEQTVHQYEKHFFPNEVVKTGQYRDHQIEEVIDRCFVMFFTRFSRGRPRAIDSSKEVYVCEARYNEEKHRFNKIKTWASCLPDEVRDKDYEMDLFDQPRRIKKVPSPLKHLLKDDAKSTDDIPSPQWGHPNAPPLVGGIHRQPRDENQSPPPERTPPPPPTPPAQPIRQASISTISHQQPRPSMDGRTSLGTGILPQLSRASSSMAPQIPPYQAQSISPAPQYLRQNSFQQTPATAHRTVTPQTPTQPMSMPYVANQQLHPTPALTAAHPANYTPVAAPIQSYARPAIHPAQVYPPYGGVMPPPTREPDVFVLPDVANESIPKSIRDQFPQDSDGRVLFFTKPPVVSNQAIYDRQSGEKKKSLAHSDKYLAAKATRNELIASRKRANEEERVETNRKRAKHDTVNGGSDTHGVKSITINGPSLLGDGHQSTAKFHEPEIEVATKAVIKSMQKWIENMTQQTTEDYKARYGDRWKEARTEDELRQREMVKKNGEKRKDREEVLAKCSNAPTYITNFSRDIWGNGFKGERY